MNAFVIEGAQVLLPTGSASVAVRVEGGVITGLDDARDGATVLDASGLILAPALVDIHGDAFEHQIMPRPGVLFPLHAALLETDRQLAINGIATAYHALTLSWEPGLRSVTQGRAVLKALATLAPRMTVENRVQLRWETFCSEAIPLIAEALAGPLMPSIAFNDHTSIAARREDVVMQDRPFDHDPDYPVADLTSESFANRIKDRTHRSGMTRDGFVALFQDVWQRRPHVPGMIAEVAAMGRAAGAAMLSHDDTRAQTRSYYRNLGSRITEFPMNMEAALAAREGGDWIAFGAPNAARGGSHLGSPGAGDMLARGLCDILASDYFYPAMLAAVARLHADGRGDLAALWKLVSTNPARASGLTDRGEIAVGQRADLTLVEWPEGQVPVVRRTMVAGRTAYLAFAAG